MLTLCHMEFYGISADFPYDQLITRTETGKIRQLYLVSRNGAAMLRYNPAVKVCVSALGSRVWCCAVTHGPATLCADCQHWRAGVHAHGRGCGGLHVPAVAGGH